MPAALEKPGTKRLRRLALRQIDKAVKALKNSGALPHDENIYEARKRIKKVRSYLRLRRPELRARDYRRQDRVLRDAAKPLTEMRDARVLCETLEKLSTDFPSVFEKTTLAGLRRFFETHREQVGRTVFESGSLKPVRASLKVARRCLKSWHSERSGRVVMNAGLKSIYRRGRVAFEKARNDPSVQNLHAWRKQAKYLLHALEVQAPAAQTMAALIEQLNQLAGGLGADHDLAVLGQKLKELFQQFPNMAGIPEIVRIIDRRRHELQWHAYDLGHNIYGEKPKEFASRLEDYWQSKTENREPRTENRE